MACSCELCELTAAGTMATAMAVDIETKTDRLVLSTRMFKHTSVLFSKVEHDHDWFFERFGALVFQFIDFCCKRKVTAQTSQMRCPNNPDGGVAILFRKSPTRFIVTFIHCVHSPPVGDIDPSEPTACTP